MPNLDPVPRIVPVDLGPRSYDIQVAADALTFFGRNFTAACSAHRAAVITDENVAPLYGSVLLAALEIAGVKTHLVRVPPGEWTKNLDIAGRLYDHLFDFNLERSDAVVALGGGVVGDLAGFIAATYQRGVPFVQVPTTLLAMVDSSVGGKTGINHPHGKNMIGAFHQPRLVFADVRTLATLPRRELCCGLAETVKHAIIRDADFFTWLEQNRDPIEQLDDATLIELVVRNCRIKSAVVAADEREAGVRAILNLGHTVGHAIEAVLKDRDVHHGEAVALGVVASCRIALGRRLIQPDEFLRVRDLFDAFQLPVQLPSPPVDELYESMKHDKKVRHGRIRFVLPRGIGDCVVVDDVSEAEARDAIASLGAG